MGLKRKHRNIDKEKVNYPILEIPLKLDINYPVLNLTEQDKFNIINNLKGKLGRAILRVDTNEIITTVSDDYKTISHVNMFNNVEETLHMSGLHFELFDINEGGKHRNRVYANYLLPSYSFDINGDVWVPFIQAYSCYDKFLSYGLLTGLYRKESESAFLIFNRALLAKRRHVRGKLELKEDMINIGRWISELGEVRRTIKNYLDKPTTEDSLQAIIEIVLRVKMHRKRLFSHKLLENYKIQFGNNYYTALISLMEYATHYLFNLNRKRPYDLSRESQILIGDNFI
jgi:hypothetical protein